MSCRRGDAEPAGMAWIRCRVRRRHGQFPAAPSAYSPRSPAAAPSDDPPVRSRPRALTGVLVSHEMPYGRGHGRAQFLLNVRDIPATTVVVRIQPIAVSAYASACTPSFCQCQAAPWPKPPMGSSRSRA